MTSLIRKPASSGQPPYTQVYKTSGNVDNEKILSAATNKAGTTIHSMNLVSSGGYGAFVLVARLAGTGAPTTDSDGDVLTCFRTDNQTTQLHPLAQAVNVTVPPNYEVYLRGTMPRSGGVSILHIPMTVF